MKLSFSVLYQSVNITIETLVQEEDDEEEGEEDEDEDGEEEEEEDDEEEADGEDEKAPTAKA